jgi:diguanylate cyclase (GGDEF)-like protein/PAS domain S-box-containing protein
VKSPAKPPNEQARQQALDLTGLLDTPPEDDFDDITALVAAQLKVPVCLVSLVDRERQWFKSRHGLQATETPRDVSFCGHVVADAAPLVVEDARRDPRFGDNPLVRGAPNVVAYAGFPLSSDTGHTLGTLCAIDHEPRQFTEDQLELLRGAARLVNHAIRRRALLRWKDSELLATLDDTSTAALLLDAQGVILWTSTRAAHLLGLSQHVVRERVDFASLCAEPEALRAAIAATAQGRRSVRGLACRTPGPPERQRALQVDLDPHLSAEGIGYVRCVVTLPLEAESPPRVLHRYEAMFDACPELLATVDGRGHLDQLNPSWERVLGWTPEQLRAQPLTSFVHPEDVERLQRALEAPPGASNGGPVLECRYRAVDGSYRLLSSVISERFGVAGLSARDVTSQAETRRRFEFNSALSSGLSELQRLYIEAGAISQAWWERALELLLRLTQSEYGFIGMIHEDEQGRYLRTHAITNIAWDDETKRLYEASRATGMVFRNLNTLFGRVIVEGKTLVSNDVAHDPRAHGRPTGHPPLRCFLGLSCGEGKQVRGMIGLANRPGGYSPELVADLETASLVLGAVMNQSETEAQRRRLESRLTTIVESTLDVILTIDERGVILSVNPAIRAVFGYEPAECLGRNVSMLMNPRDREGHDGYLQRYLSTREARVIGKGRQVLGVRKDGSDVWLDLSVWEHVEAGARTFHGLMRDITERVMTERRLREAAAELSDALELAKAGRWELDMEADRFSFNDAFYRIFGVTAAQVGGYHLTPLEYATRFVHPEEVSIVKEEVGRALASTEASYAREIEHRFLYANGRVGYLAVRILGSRDQTGRLRRLFGIMQDVTSRREQEAERQQMLEQSRVASALKERVEELDRARTVTALLTECVNYLQRSVSVEEGLELIARYVDRMYPQADIVVYSLLPGSEELVQHTEVRRGASAEATTQVLQLADCWALRTRKLYSMYRGGPHLRCRHVEPESDRASVCAPIIGAEGLVGLICLTFPAGEFSTETPEASDRLMRDLSRLETMAQSLSGAMSTIILRESLQRLALVDELTGLPNRRAFLSNAARLAARARRTRDSFVVAIYDVDHFKSVNDTFGHDEGDRVLRRISELAQQLLRADDLIGRLGGEEFGLLLVGSEQGIRAKLEALREKIAQAAIIRDKAITISVGYAVSSVDYPMSIDDLLKVADIALYAAKTAGRDRVMPERRDAAP